MKKAIAAYREAKDFEDALIYTEPRDWLIPTRHYLANALIKTKAYAEAEKILKEDLKQNPSNSYALSGMSRIQQEQKKHNDYYGGSLRKAFTNADMKEPALLY